MPRRRKKNDKVHVLSFPFTNDHIFSIWIIIRTYRESLKNISVQCRQCCAILFWNRSRDCSVCITLEDGVLRRTPAQVFQCTWFLFCLFGVEGVKRTAKSSLPLAYVKEISEYPPSPPNSPVFWNLSKIINKRKQHVLLSIGPIDKRTCCFRLLIIKECLVVFFIFYSNSNRKSVSKQSRSLSDAGLCGVWSRLALFTYMYAPQKGGRLMDEVKLDSGFQWEADHHILLTSVTVLWHLSYVER